MSTYDFPTLYTTLPHVLIKEKLIDLIEKTFQRELSPYLACSDKMRFNKFGTKKVSEYDQEIPQLHTADNPRYREEEPQNIYSSKTSERQ